MYIKLCFSLGQIAIKLGQNIHCWAWNNDDELLSFLYFYCCYTRCVSDRQNKEKAKPTSEKYVKKLVVINERKTKEKMKGFNSYGV